MNEYRIIGIKSKIFYGIWLTCFMVACSFRAEHLINGLTTIIIMGILSIGALLGLCSTTKHGSKRTIRASWGVMVCSVLGLLFGIITL